MKTVLRGKFVAFIRKEERSKIIILSFYHRTVEKEVQLKSKISKREDTKIRAEMNEIKNKKSVMKICETQSRIFGKIREGAFQMSFSESSFVCIIGVSLY